MKKVMMTADGWPVYRGDKENSEAWMVDTSTAGTTYICYKNDPRRIIRRIVTSSGVTTIEWTYGKWEDRASLAYHPIEASVEFEV